MTTTLDPAMAMRELRHRTDNAFQMVGGLLAREARQAEASAAFVLRKAEAQVHAFALLNRVLDETSMVDGLQPCAGAYLKALCVHLRAACLLPLGVGLETALDQPCLVDERCCRALALITTELVLNAAKHAFNDRPHGLVGVCLGRALAPDRLMLGVMDNGCGIPAAPDPSRQGLGFVRTLAASLGGECRIETGPEGTRVAITAPLAA